LALPVSMGYTWRLNEHHEWAPGLPLPPERIIAKSFEEGGTETAEGETPLQLSNRDACNIFQRLPQCHHAKNTHPFPRHISAFYNVGCRDLVLGHISDALQCSLIPSFLPSPLSSCSSPCVFFSGHDAMSGVAQEPAKHALLFGA
jgi:hypothetical protein